MDAVIEDLKELIPGGGVGAAQTTQERWLQLGRQFRRVQGFMSVGKKEF